MKYVVGHRNADTDSVASAILLADLFGDNYEPAVDEDLNKETKYILDLLKIKKPIVLPCNSEGYVLVDHNELGQTPKEVVADKIEMIVDHHKLGGLSLPSPIKVKIEPLGSTCTIVYELYKENKQSLSQDKASLMLSGIISDTLNFKSPTTTAKDVDAAKELEKISGLNADSFAEQMFGAKSDITGDPIELVINQDYKNFELGCKRVGFGVFETVSPEPVLSRIEEFCSALDEKKNADKLDYIFFAIIDIVSEVAYLILLSKSEEELALSAYMGDIESGYMVLPGIVSRKKQMIPALEKKLENA